MSGIVDHRQEKYRIAFNFFLLNFRYFRTIPLYLAVSAR